MTLIIGKPIIQILAATGAWQSENGIGLVAADDLIHRDPYAEIERLRAEIERLQAGWLRWRADNDHYDGTADGEEDWG